MTDLLPRSRPRDCGPRAPWGLLAVLLLALLAASGGDAQTARGTRRPEAPKAKPAAAEKPATRPVDPNTRYPLLRVQVEGGKRFGSKQVAALAGLEVGVPANRDTFVAAHKRLVDSGHFESVAYRFEKPATENGYVVTFEVTETELYYPIRLEDIPAPLEEVNAYLRERDPSFDGHASATEPGMKRYAAMIEDFLRSRGTGIKVRGVVWAEQGGDLSVMFRPDTPIPSISDVRFSGTESIEPLEVRRILIQTATGILFTEDRFRTVLNNEVLPAYWAIAHLGVRFPVIKAVPLDEEKGVRVEVTVEDGPEYTLREARVLATEYREQDLLELARFPVGETALWTKVATGIKAIQARVKRDGYLNASVTYEPKLFDEDAQVDLTIVVQEGPRYLFRSLKIEGLDLVTEQEIRKLWSMDPGKPFNGLYPDFFLEQIRERQLMDGLGGAKSKVEFNERSHDATVTLTFQPVDKTPKPRIPLVRPQ